MARATDLPIYRAAYDLLQLLAKLTQQYPRGYRQGLAREVFAEAQMVVVGIFRANCTSEKASAIEGNTTGRFRRKLQFLPWALPPYRHPGADRRHWPGGSPTRLPGGEQSHQDQDREARPWLTVPTSST